MNSSMIQTDEMSTLQTITGYIYWNINWGSSKQQKMLSAPDVVETCVKNDKLKNC